MSRSRSYDQKLIAFTAPSGAGKTTIVRHLLETFDFLDFSVSATTRPRRSHEKEGVHYHFLSEDEFREKIREDAFAEFEEVYAGQLYGTLKSEIQRIWDNNKVVVFDIDVKGASSLKTLYGEDCYTVFIKPPSLQTLIDRLKARRTETPESFRKRVIRAREEMAYEGRFDTVLVNDLLDVALKEAEVLVKDFLDLDVNGN
ncbi:MAG: guanylate kinase [Saprospiraceae bacterium]|nr:guanylate kinase [Saprospiraceae bacterium]